MTNAATESTPEYTQDDLNQANEQEQASLTSNVTEYLKSRAVSLRLEVNRLENLSQGLAQQNVALSEEVVSLRNQVAELTPAQAPEVVEGSIVEQ